MDVLLVELLAPLGCLFVAGLVFVDLLARPKPPIGLHALRVPPSGLAPPLGKAGLLALAPEAASSG